MTREDQELQEIYDYGYKLLALQAANLAVAIAIGLVFSCLKEMALFLIAYIPLRSYAGGYHAEGPVKCGILSAAIELTLAAVLQLPAAAGLHGVLLSAAALCWLVIYVVSPVAAQNKPLTDSQIVSFRRKTRGILGAEMIAIAVLYFIGFWELVTAVAASHIFVAALLLVEKIREN